MGTLLQQDADYEHTYYFPYDIPQLQVVPCRTNKETGKRVGGYQLAVPPNM